MKNFNLNMLRFFLALVLAALGASGLAFAGGGGADPSKSADSSASSGVKDELKETQKANAAVRKSKGLGRTTTSDDRQAAAARNQARKEAAEKMKGGQP